MGAAAAAGTGWSLLVSAGFCALAWVVFAVTRPGSVASPNGGIDGAERGPRPSRP